MSLLSYMELCALVEDGVIVGVGSEQLNAASIDLTLGPEILVEDLPKSRGVVRLARREAPMMRRLSLVDGGSDQFTGYLLRPGEFVLAHTEQVFNLPNDISAEFKLKSSMARAGLNHALAGWADAGWHGSVLTLELVNWTQHHTLWLEPGMPIGQMIFYRHTPVPEARSYAARGSYNRDTGVQAAKRRMGEEEFSQALPEIPVPSPCPLPEGEGEGEGEFVRGDRGL